jgi:precorrin-6A synthase
VYAIGIGAGDPEHVTVQAIGAMNAVEVFFVVEKGPDKRALEQLRLEICERYIEHDRYRIVAIPDPERDRDATAYAAAVREWRVERARRYEQAIATELGEDGVGAFLVWGDPSLYDSTLASLEAALAGGHVTFEVEVIPGITSVQALAARHRTVLNRVGGDVRITTGRRLREGRAKLDDDLVVMLDAECSFKALAGEEGVEIYWGAYVGTPQEILIAGPLAEVAEEIESARARARERNGWVMDTYLLRRRRDR